MGKNVEILPTIDPLFEISDGYICSAPEICKKKLEKECCDYYTKISNQLGFHSCPFGLHSYVDFVNGEVVIYTGLVIRNYTTLNKKRFRYMIKPNAYTHNQILNLIKLNREHLKLNEQISANQRNNELFRHDFNKINGMIKNFSSTIAELTDSKHLILPKDKIHINEYSVTMQGIAQLLEYKLAMYDYDTYLKSSVTNNKLVPIYKKFHKFIHIFNNYKKANGIPEKINNIQGSCSYKIEINEQAFELLVYLILENAIQHSQLEEKVNISVINSNGIPIYTIINKSKYTNSSFSDANEYFEYGKKNKDSNKGSGIGLYLAKTICDQYNINISVKKRSCPKSEEELVVEQEFILTLVFNNANL